MNPIINDTTGVNVSGTKIFLNACLYIHIRQFFNHRIPIALPIGIVLSNFLTKKCGSLEV